MVPYFLKIIHQGNSSIETCYNLYCSIDVIACYLVSFSLSLEFKAVRVAEISSRIYYIEIGTLLDATLGSIQEISKFLLSWKS